MHGLVKSGLTLTRSCNHNGHRGSFQKKLIYAQVHM